MAALLKGFAFSLKIKPDGGYKFYTNLTLTLHFSAIKPEC